MAAIIGACGLVCSGCQAYQATQSGDRAAMSAWPRYGARSTRPLASPLSGSLVMAAWHPVSTGAGTALSAASADAPLGAA